MINSRADSEAEDHDPVDSDMEERDNQTTLQTCDTLVINDGPDAESVFKSHKRGFRSYASRICYTQKEYDGTIGLPASSTDVKVMDEQGQEGEEGKDGGGSTENGDGTRGDGGNGTGHGSGEGGTGNKKSKSQNFTYFVLI